MSANAPILPVETQPSTSQSRCGRYLEGSATNHRQGRDQSRAGQSRVPSPLHVTSLSAKTMNIAMAQSHPHRSQSRLINHHLHRHRRPEETEETVLVERVFVDELRKSGLSGQRLESRVARLKGVFNRFALMKDLEAVPELGIYPQKKDGAPSLDALRQWRSNERAKTYACAQTDEAYGIREMVEIIYAMLLSEYVDWYRATSGQALKLSQEDRYELRKGNTFRTIKRELGVALLPMLANTPGPLSNLSSVA